MTILYCSELKMDKSQGEICFSNRSFLGLLEKVFYWVLMASLSIYV